jgi:hypothetical protein
MSKKNKRFKQPQIKKPARVMKSGFFIWGAFSLRLRLIKLGGRDRITAIRLKTAI